MTLKLVAKTDEEGSPGAVLREAITHKSSLTSVIVIELVEEEVSVTASTDLGAAEVVYYLLSAIDAIRTPIEE